jgi:hypothetical protein
MIRLHELFSTVFYVAASIIFAVFSIALIVFAISEVLNSLDQREDLLLVILHSVGLVVVSVAVFDVAKFLMEEQVLRKGEVRTPEESKKTLTKFMTIIAIAVSLEALVFIFAAGKSDMTTLIYPTLLLLGAVAIVVGLGYYQKLSTIAENTSESPPGRRHNQHRRERQRDQGAQRQA